MIITGSSNEILSPAGHLLHDLRLDVVLVVGLAAVLLGGVVDGSGAEQSLEIRLTDWLWPGPSTDLLLPYELAGSSNWISGQRVLVGDLAVIPTSQGPRVTGDAQRGEGQLVHVSPRPDGLHGLV